MQKQKTNLENFIQSFKKNTRKIISPLLITANLATVSYMPQFSSNAYATVQANDKENQLRKYFGNTKLLLECRNGYIRYIPSNGSFSVDGNDIVVNGIRISSDYNLDDPNFFDYVFFNRSLLFKDGLPNIAGKEEINVDAMGLTIKQRPDGKGYMIEREEVKLDLAYNADILVKPIKKPKIATKKIEISAADTSVVRVVKKNTSTIKHEYTTHEYIAPKLDLRTLKISTKPKHIEPKNIPRNYETLYPSDKVSFKNNPINLDSLNSVATLDFLVSQELRRPHSQFIVPRQIERCEDILYASEEIGEIDLGPQIDSLSSKFALENLVASETSRPFSSREFYPRTIPRDQLANNTLEISKFAQDCPLIISIPAITEIREIQITPERLSVIPKKPKINHKHSTTRNVILGIVGASAGYVIVDAITPEKSSNQKSNESEPGIH